MSSAEFAYLLLSLAGFAVFTAALLGATHYCNTGPQALARRDGAAAPDAPDTAHPKAA